MASQDQHLHFVLIPLMSPGHMIPMTNMARLFAERGVLVTLVTTPLNALRVKTVIDHAIESGLPLQLLELRFPCLEVGLPEACENFDSLPSKDLAKNFFAATSMLQQPLEQWLGQLQALPSCIISSIALPWTSNISRKLRIPWLVFHGTCCFSLFCCHSINHHKVCESVTPQLEPIRVPGTPDPVEFTKAQLPFRSDLDFHGQMRKAELTSYGVVINSFYELEPRYVDEYQRAIGKKSWCIGPLSPSNKETSVQAERGKNGLIDENQCLEWLHSREPKSVVYACLGSLCGLVPSQLIQIGLGLEASNCPFIWVIGRGNKSLELEKWLSEERFQERTKERGLLIHGWAPQVQILSHPAIGGFLTHCGWNSTLEGVCAGVPTITWPMCADQFLNEKLVERILGTGVRVGVNIPVNRGEEEKVGVVVKGEEVKKAIDKLMDDGEEGQERRRRARELREMAERAMEEGGSSHLNVSLLIQDIMQQTNHKQTTQTMTV